MILKKLPLILSLFACTILQAKTITLGAYNLPPYNYGKSAKDFKGVDTEITIAVLKEMGHEVKLSTEDFIN